MMPLASAQVAARGGYWDSYYAQGKTLVAPSQFATFVAAECPDHDLVVDIGCGNGRDALFFAHLGHRVIGIDGSQSAIDHCRSRLSTHDESGSPHQFLRSDVSDLSDESGLMARMDGCRKVLYSRFFLHAIHEAEERAFFEFVDLAMRPRDTLALEFRTLEDEGRCKVTGAHYRRYIDSSRLVQSVLRDLGLHLQYWVEGTGYAKYRDDDAYVCRVLFTRPASC